MGARACSGEVAEVGFASVVWANHGMVLVWWQTDMVPIGWEEIVCSFKVSEGWLRNSHCRNGVADLL